MSSRPRVIGMVGGVGSGKSTVARLFAECGAAVVDADRIAHEVLKRPTVKNEVARRWGREVFRPDGEVDRAALGRAVFAEPNGAETLNALVHPLIRVEMEREMRAARAAQAARLIVVDAPLLLEAGREDWCDALVFVDAPRAVRAERVHIRHGWPAAELDRREARQLDVEAKRARCAYTIDNSGSEEQTAAQVRRLGAQLVSEKPQRSRLAAASTAGRHGGDPAGTSRKDRGQTR